MSKKLKAGLIGVGSMGRGHLDNYVKLLKEDSDIELVALCDIDEKKFTNYKADFNLGPVGEDGYDFDRFRLYTDLDDLLENESLDMVTIALPTYLHAWATVKCLDKGINVLCEKPMATTYEDCLKMIEASERNGKFLMIGQCLRFATPYLTLKKYVDEKLLGECVAAHFFRGGGTPLWSYQNWLLDREKGGGALFDQHIHDVDAINFIFGMPDRVSTAAKTLFEKSAYDTCSTNYYYDGCDRPINAQNDWALTGPYFYQNFRANFEQGTIVRDTQGFFVYRKDGTTETVELPQENPYYNETVYFAECILKGEAPDRATARQAADTVRIALAEMRSADGHGALTDV